MRKMNADDDNSSSTAKVEISPKGAAALMQLLIQRGYFHANVHPLQAKHVTSKDFVPPIFSEDDENALIVATTSGGATPEFVSTLGLCEKFQQHLQQAGRLSVSEAAQRLKITEKAANRIRRQVFVSQESTLLQHGDELLTSSYLDQKVCELTESLMSSSSPGTLSLSEAARSVLYLPFELTLSVLASRLPSYIEIRTLDTGSKILITKDCLAVFQTSVFEAFRTVSEPVQLSSICKKNGWQKSWVTRILKDLVASDQNPDGELHGDTYVPKCYLQRQRHAVRRAFSPNGYITDKQAHLNGMSLSQVIDCIRPEYPSALVLSRSIVHPDIVVGPLEAAIQDAIAANGWLDLQLHLPLELLQIEQDAKAIVVDYVLASLDDKNHHLGAVAIQSDGGLFFSPAMVAETTTSILLPLFEKLASEKAIELDKKFGADFLILGKDKRKAKRSSKQTDQPSVDFGTVPIIDIARAVVDQHMALAEYLATAEESDEDSALLSICETAFATENLQQVFQKYVQVEINRLVLARESTATTSRNESMSKVQSIECAFEDAACFPTACYMIQEVRKFIEYAADSGMDEVSLSKLKEVFLEGCCADFTSRLTQYCLFKNAIDMQPFSFRPESIETDEPGVPLPLYYGPVDVAVRSYNTICISKRPNIDVDSREPLPLLHSREPLPLLRTILPGTVGVTLARQWVLCGGKCYEGGVKLSYVRPGDVEGFMAHVEENCLSVCGLPFKKLDKKKEKLFLACRRQCLCSLLQTENDAAIVLDLSVMLLFQLVKNMVACFSAELLRGPILALLIRERKIPSSVAKDLTDLAKTLESGEKVDADLVDRVRACGLSRDK
jgi:hypothetical protein